MVKIFQVDSFTDEPFRGNPAAVSILDGPADELWMQSVAQEMNLSETAFLCREDGASNGFNLRWFTPTVEVSLCGHATLASAHILWETGIVKDFSDILFSTLSGELRVWREGELTWMDFPIDKPVRAEAPDGLFDALGLSAALVEVFKGSSDYLLGLDREEDLLNVNPDFEALKKIEARGFIVTAKSEKEGIDFVSRFFAPAFGIDEDPVTGSAHTTLAPFWMEKLGKAELKASQLSSRGGLIRMRIVSASDGSGGARVHLGGKAVTVFSGKFS